MVLSRYSCLQMGTLCVALAMQTARGFCIVIRDSSRLGPRECGVLLLALLMVASYWVKYLEDRPQFVMSD